MSSAASPGGLVGRENELALLHGLLREAAHGRGNAVLIEGEPGIGKSVLVRSMVAQARDMSCEVFWGTGDELGQELPLIPFLDALKVHQPSASARRAAIVQLLRGEAVTDRGADVPRAVAEQLLALLTEQCATRPAILVIDDLQWADPSSVALWARLARLTGQMPLLLVGMMRPVPLREELLALRRALDQGSRLQLLALAGSAVADLVEALAGGKPDGDLLELADGAAGNPLYLTELVAALTRSDRLTITESGAAELAAGGSVPTSLSAVIADRIGFVTGPVREVVQAAALLGVGFSVTDLAVVLGRKVPDLIPVINEARAAGLLAECGNSLGFRHPLIREALYDEMPIPLRAAWHRDAGRALASAGAPADRVARQILRAADGLGDAPLDEWMLNWLARAADPLVGQAPGVAAELLTRAVTSVPTGSARYSQIASRLADALYRIGDTTQAEKVAHRALDHTAEADVLVDLHWTLVQCRGLAGISAESLHTLDRALEAPGISTRHRARLLVLAARTHFTLGDAEKTEQAANDALAVATEAGDNWAMSWALLMMAHVATVRGRMTDGLPLYDRALSATQADPALSDLRMLLQINKAVTLSCLDQYDQAFAAAKQARRLAGEVGTVIRLAQAHGALGQLLFETGQWNEALSEVAVLPENLKEPAGACCELGIASVISFHRGDPGTARSNLAAAVPYSDRIGQRFIGPLALARSLEREQAGAIQEAFSELAAGFDSNSEGLDEVEDLLADAARLAIQIGNNEVATSLAERADKLADDSPVPHRQANALYCRGMLDHDPDKLMAAARRYEDAGRPLLRAKALEAAAVEFVESEERGQGRDAFSRSVEVYESLGADADVQRVLALFRSYGIRRGPHSKHRQAQSGWDSLTPMEQKIAAFVEEGLSNPDIAARLTLSRRTVGTHVSHILKKLGVGSRTDIARESALRSIASR